MHTRLMRAVRWLLWWTLRAALRHPALTVVVVLSALLAAAVP